MDSIWYEILVIILASFLAFALILTIIILFKVLEILKIVRRITEHAEHVADQAEHISDFFQKTATPVALMKLVSNISDLVGKKGKK